MPRKRSFASQAYRFARTVNTVSTVASGNPKRIARRSKNVVVGRSLGPVWRRLWR